MNSGSLSLIDEGVTPDEVRSRREADLPFKSLLAQELAHRLSGSSDLTAEQAPVGQ